MKPFATEGELQLLEDIVLGRLGGGQVLDDSAISLDDAARPLRKRPTFLPMRHRDKIEAFRQPGVSEGLAFGGVHADLITFLRKELQNQPSTRILLFPPHNLLSSPIFIIFLLK
ncbi:MAG: hypothetical protein AB7I98_08655 [Verrucomicrobiales bacterium]|nr:hypothetical protein [Verrucomicrobiae bacterium]